MDEDTTQQQPNTVPKKSNWARWAAVAVLGAGALAGGGYGTYRALTPGDRPERPPTRSVTEDDKKQLAVSLTEARNYLKYIERQNLQMTEMLVTPDMPLEEQEQLQNWQRGMMKEVKHSQELLAGIQERAGGGLTRDDAETLSRMAQTYPAMKSAPGVIDGINELRHDAMTPQEREDAATRFDEQCRHLQLAASLAQSMVREQAVPGR